MQAMGLAKIMRSSGVLIRGMRVEHGVDLTDVFVWRGCGASSSFLGRPLPHNRLSPRETLRPAVLPGWNVMLLVYELILKCGAR
jgi:hypothetical protein